MEAGRLWSLRVLLSLASKRRQRSTRLLHLGREGAPALNEGYTKANIRYTTCTKPLRYLVLMVHASRPGQNGRGLSIGTKPMDPRHSRHGGYLLTIDRTPATICSSDDSQVRWQMLFLCVRCHACCPSKGYKRTYSPPFDAWGATLLPFLGLSPFSRREDRHLRDSRRYLSTDLALASCREASRLRLRSASHNRPPSRLAAFLQPGTRPRKLLCGSTKPSNNAAALHCVES
ncbi:hypothetical protein CONLIGDRAFT_204681 [Coniochaeta ligniaria NRRL 30616]|uniref:Uncharacterized protein n=1 Tax=Coniochaeta ligniaria NRRL 30616 TaxID=1408157 RepID=A0A1J7J2K7_9PEZI|nr:hypothetical protein CONLIGDRAFT_204681 [Coniochaeta ligniaria NRRL 30616]